MGMALGKITVETPPHTIVHKTENYQIWRYPKSIAAKVHATDLNLSPTSTESDFTSAAFRSLARYIGVFGTPQNTLPNSVHSPTPEGERIAMTAPVVITSGKIDMTAPVVMTPGNAEGEVADMSMSFFLPGKYGEVGDVPVPSNPAVKLVEIPCRYCAVVQFSGNLTMKASREYAEMLLSQLEKDSVKVVGDWSYCGYNPPITLPWLKRNEVHVPIEGSQFDSVTENVE